MQVSFFDLATRLAFLRNSEPFTDLVSYTYVRPSMPFGGKINLG
ncbi:hypothetical protein SBA4_7270001 [Candidatus Sulfopaludibacter sp. SbA4]|nr:hypothetical protein SBA4_7270001 [Candidatus Sulfopaludibacter sp. SbA4]